MKDGKDAAPQQAEEFLAEDYRKTVAKWRDQEQHGSMLGKAWLRLEHWAYQVLAMFRAKRHNAYYQLYSGKVFQRSAMNEASSHVMYMMNPENWAKDFLKNQKNQISKTMLRHWDKDLAAAKENPHITAEGQTLDTGLNNSFKSTSRINDPLTRVVHSWADTAMMTYRQNYAKCVRLSF